MRRILGHVELGLPDAPTRARLWRSHIPARLPVRLSESDWDSLVEATDGLAGGDILNAVMLAAATVPEREGAGCRIARDDLLVTVAAGKRARQAIT